MKFASAFGTNFGMNFKTLFSERISKHTNQTFFEKLSMEFNIMCWTEIEFNSKFKLMFLTIISCTSRNVLNSVNYATKFGRIMLQHFLFFVQKIKVSRYVTCSRLHKTTLQAYHNWLFDLIGPWNESEAGNVLVGDMEFRLAWRWILIFNGY